MRYSNLIGSIVFLFLFSCGEKEPPRSAFYHWKTRLEIDSEQQEWMQKLEAQRLYVKFFDLDWNANAQRLVPLAQLRVDTHRLAGIKEIVPCIYITNRSFLNANKEELQSLPKQLIRKVLQLKKQLPEYLSIRELQIDCDWTPRSRAAFFTFLDSVRSHAEAVSWQTSVTIRLHQLADPKGTGVPPADRGMLMFYNMGALDNWQEPNSILNLEAAKPYLSRAGNTYPLPLDLALPVFSWGVLYRDGYFTRLLNNLDTIQLSDTSRFEKLDTYRFRVRKNGYLQSSYVYQDDLIRVETTQPSQLRASRELLRPFLRSAHYISFYHLDASVLKKLPYGELEVFFDD